jgi:hypothetical protein
MPRIQSETIGTGDLSWLGSTHGISNARTETIDISAFTAATHYPGGYIPSGFPLAKVGGLMVPYDPTAGTTANAGMLAGHLLTDFKVVGGSGGVDLAAPVLDHGRVKASKIAGLLASLSTFVAPQVPAKNATTIVYI